MGTAASFGFPEERQQQRPRIDYNKLLSLTFYDMVKCDSQRKIVVNRGQRVVSTRISSQVRGTKLVCALWNSEWFWKLAYRVMVKRSIFIYLFLKKQVCLFSGWCNTLRKNASYRRSGFTVVTNHKNNCRRAVRRRIAMACCPRSVLLSELRRVRTRAMCRTCFNSEAVDSLQSQ